MINAFYMGLAQPPGFEIAHSPPLVCKLHKASYGLCQAPRAWFAELHSTLVAFGFTSAKSDQSLFTRFTGNTYLLVYVDDILITDNDSSTIHSQSTVTS